MRSIMIAAAFLFSVPAMSQIVEPAASATTLDPQRIAVALRLMDQIMPSATRDGMMRSIMASMSQTMVAGMRQNPELNTALSKLPGAQEVFDRFVQRQMSTGTQDMITELPGMIDAMANAYARRFTLAQLNDISAFFATPTGQVYVAQSSTVMADPDVAAWMSGLMTRSMKRLPAQMAELKAEIEALNKKKSGS